MTFETFLFLFFVGVFTLILYVAVIDGVKDQAHANPKYQYRIKKKVLNGRTTYKVYRRLWFTPYKLLETYKDLVTARAEIKRFKRNDKIALGNKEAWMTDEEIMLEEL